MMLKRMLLCLLVVLLCAPALAEEVVELPDAVVTYTPPEGFYRLTRESSASAFNKLGLSQRSLLRWMEQNDCYAVMYDLETGAEILLYLAPSEDLSLDAMTPQELEQLCAYLAEDYELAGYEDVSVAVYQGAAGRYIKSASKTYETDGTPCYTVGLVAIRSGCWVNMSLFTYFDAPSGEMNARLLKMADSLRMTLPDGLTELSAHGVTLRLSLPAGLSLQADAAMLAGLVPEKPAGEVIGVAAAEDGSWYVQWQLIEGARSDMERVSGSGLRSLYEDRANRKKGMGFTVTAMSAVTDLRQRYIRLSYEMPQEGSESWFAEEYYTKQGGWGVVITAYSCGQPLTEEASAAFLEVIAAQLITVKAE